MSKIIFMLLTPVLLLCAPLASAQNPDPNDDNPVVVMSEAKDPAMVRARNKAIKSLPQYWDAMENCASCEGFVIKVGFDTPDGSTEHMWIESTQRAGDKITGILDNEPKKVPTMTIGQSVEFTPDDVSDWTYSKNGRTEGHFTTRVLLTKLPEDQAAYYANILGWTKGEDY